MLRELTTRRDARLLAWSIGAVLFITTVLATEAPQRRGPEEIEGGDLAWISSSDGQRHVMDQSGPRTRRGAFTVAPISRLSSVHTVILVSLAVLFGAMIARLKRPPATASGEVAPPKPRSPITPAPRPPVAAAEPRGLHHQERIFLARLQQVLDDNLDNEHFTVGLMARQMAVSRSQLYRRLQALGGHSPCRLLMERRLERAAELLTEENVSVTRVAYSLGFKSASHFSQRFKARYGVSPSSYVSQNGWKKDCPSAETDARV